MRHAETQAEEPAPGYAETLTRIRARLPILQRSLSLSAQRWGRGMSVKRKSMKKKSVVRKERKKSVDEDEHQV